MPIRVTSKENKITNTVSDPGFCEAPKSEQNRVPQRKLASYDPWVNSNQLTIFVLLASEE